MRTLLLMICAMVLVPALTGWAHDVTAPDDGPPGPGRAFQVLRAMPDSPDAYRGHAADLVRGGVPEKFGQEEWAAVVLAQELHQHIGIMTIVGAKMAVRAGEVLEAPGRAVHVVSETGPEPPYSCAIDGLQAGLGSTYAQQLIEAPPVDEPRLAARFTYQDRAVRLSLKPEYQRRIAHVIQTAIRDHGNLTPAYFNVIEHYSYDVWGEWDRREVFDVEFLEGGAAVSPTDP